MLLLIRLVFVCRVPASCCGGLPASELVSWVQMAARCQLLDIVPTPYLPKIEITVLLEKPNQTANGKPLRQAGKQRPTCTTFFPTFRTRKHRPRLRITSKRPSKIYKGRNMRILIVTTRLLPKIQCLWRGACRDFRSTSGRVSVYYHECAELLILATLGSFMPRASRFCAVAQL